MRFRKNSQEENCVTPDISGVKEKSLKGSELWLEKSGPFAKYRASIGKSGGKYKESKIT